MKYFFVGRRKGTSCVYMRKIFEAESYSDALKMIKINWRNYDFASLMPVSESRVRSRK